jgi:hypothetical protein
MIRGKLRTKFLISLTFVTAALTWATLYVVRYRVQVRVRETITQELDSSVRAFLRLQEQREQSLERTAALLVTGRQRPVCAHRPHGWTGGRALQRAQRVDAGFAGQREPLDSSAAHARLVVLERPSL